MGRGLGCVALSRLFLWLFGGNSRFLGSGAAGDNKICSFSAPAALRNLDRGRALIIISLDMNVPLGWALIGQYATHPRGPRWRGLGAKRRLPPLKGIFLAGIKTNTIFRIPDWQIFRRNRSGQLRLVENFDAF